METDPPVFCLPAAWSITLKVQERVLWYDQQTLSTSDQNYIVQVCIRSFATNRFHRLLGMETVEAVETVDFKPFPATLMNSMPENS